MSSERIQSVDKRVKNLLQEATNLKTSQNTGWDSIRSYLIQTTNEWDYSYTPTFVSGQATEIMHIYIKYIADHQDAPMAQARADILVDGSNTFRVGGFTEDHQLTKDFGIDTNGWVPDIYGNYSPTGTPNKTNELSFYNAISFFRETNVKVKFRINAVDSGRMIVKVSNNDFTGIIIQ